MRLRILSSEFALSDEQRDEIETRIRFALTRFRPRVRSVDAYVDSDGAETQFNCKIRVRFRGGAGLFRGRAEVLAHATDVRLMPVVSRAIERIERATARHIEEQRLAWRSAW